MRHSLESFRRAEASWRVARGACDAGYVKRSAFEYLAARNRTVCEWVNKYDTVLAVLLFI
eukprot:2457808-Amphidinium_carterae.1